MNLIQTCQAILYNNDDFRTVVEVHLTYDGYYKVFIEDAEFPEYFHCSKIINFLLSQINL